jgi:hypothetical protein
MRWGTSALLLIVSVVVFSPAAGAQNVSAPKPVNPFGPGGAVDQPPAPQPVNPFGGGEAAPQPAAAPAVDPTGGDPAKQQQLLDDMVAKKVIYKAHVKGRTASLWVGAPFAELPADQQTNLARAAYKVWVIGTEGKFKGPMTILLSDGQKSGARLGLYYVGIKGDGVKIFRTNRGQQQQAGGFDPGFFPPPVAPVEPADDGSDPFNM